MPDGKGDFSLFSAKDDVASLRLVVDSDPVKTIPLPSDPTKVVLTLPRRIKRTPAKSPNAMLDMKATRRWIARLERLGRKWPEAAETAAVATRIGEAARAAAEHDLGALSTGVLAGQPGAALELDRILSTVPQPGAPSAPRVTGGEPAAWPTLALDAILDPDRPADTSPSPDKRKLSKAHARLLAAAAVAGRGNDRHLLRNAVAALRLVHDLRVLQLLGSAPARMGGDSAAYRELTHTARNYEHAGRSSEPYGSPAPVSLVEPAPLDDVRPLIWDIPEFRDFAAVVREARNAEITAGPHDKRIAFDPVRACEGQKVTIRHEAGLWTGRSITGVRFSSRRNVASLPAAFTVVDDEIIVEEIPVGAVSGPVAIDLAPGDYIIEFRGMRVNLEPGGTTHARFFGGMTALFLVSMRPWQSWRDGLVAGTHIDVQWQASNVEEIRGEFVGGDTTVSFRARASEELLVPSGRHRVRLADSIHRYDVRCTLTGRGPCGDATPIHTTAGVCRSERLLGSSEDPFPFEERRFANWHRNIDRAVRIAAPQSVEDLIRAVRTAERGGARLGVKGRGCSYTDVVSPAAAARQRIVDLWLLRTTRIKRLQAQQRALGQALRDDITSVLEPHVQSAYMRHTRLRGAPLTDVRQRLVPVRAGTRFNELNWLLDSLTPRLSLATMGGGTAHSLGGAFATGTHGATFHLPPPGDFVRAMRVIGARGRVWWVEPATNPITSEAGLRSSGLFDDVDDECVQVVYDDEVFDALLVSIGCGGIVSDLVIETIDAHMMRRTVNEGDWATARPNIERDIAQIQRVVTDPPVDGLPPLWFYAFTVLSSGRTWIDQQWLDPSALPSPPSSGPASAALTSGTPWFLIALGELLALLGALPLVLHLVIQDIIIEIAELIASVLFPWEWDNIDDQARDLEDALAALGHLAELVVHVLDMVESASDPDDQVDALTTGINLLWTLTGVPFLPVELGRHSVDHIMEHFAPDQLDVEKLGPERSFFMISDGDSSPGRDTGETVDGNLINSREFAVPAGDTLAFVDALMAGVARIREGGDAAIMVANIRFTRSTRATVGMQQFWPLTGHIEVYTAEGLDGTPAAEAMIDGVAARFSAAPHWGQVHSPALAANAYAWKRSWANAMARLDPEGVGTFRREFVADRGLY